MRKGGLEKLADTAERPPRRGLAIAAVAAVIAVIGGGYALWNARAPSRVEGDPPLEPLALRETRGYMENEGVTSTRGSDLLEPGDAAEELAERIRGGSPEEQARSLARHVSARREAGAFEAWSLSLPRREELHTQEQVAAALARDGGRAHLFPLEVAALVVAALRSDDVPAMLAEVWGYEGERAPLDPSGQLGYYAVAVYPDEPGEGTPAIVDVYGGRDAAPPEGSYRVLTDVQAVSAALVARAQHALHVEADGARALGVIEDALKLDPRSPSARVTRGLVLVAAQGLEDARREIESAASIRGDAPRKVALAMVHVLGRDLDAAEREIRAALEQSPDYAIAHLRLATLQLEAGDTEAARASLEEADRLEAGVPELGLLYAQYHVLEGENDLARSRARAAASESPHSFQTQLMAAQIFRATGDTNDMRRAVQAAIAAVPEARRDRVRDQIRQSMGEEALEPPSEGGDEEPPPASAGLELRLDGPTAPDAPAGDLELGAGEGAPGEGGPILQLGDPSDYRLLGPNDRLQLRLGQ